MSEIFFEIKSIKESYKFLGFSLKKIAFGKMKIINESKVVLSLDVCSGGWFNGYLPIGKYNVLSIVTKSKNINNKPFWGKNKAWWIPIIPKFRTIRNGFAIHIDNSPKGTAGCIGINIKDEFEFLKIFNLFKPKTLNVYKI